MKHVPLGLRDYLPKDIQQREHIIKKMADVVLNEGYERIITPAIERYDQIQAALGDLSDDCISFFDRGGSRLVLRPDHTTAIARIVSLRLGNALPVKLFYYDSVFRRDPQLGETEIFQFGFEHIGDLSIHDELQMIRMVSMICNAVGLHDHEIHIAHPEIFNAISDQDLDSIQKGDLVSFNEIPKIGKKELAKDYSYLSKLFGELPFDDMDNVFLNLGLYKDARYYNGVYFDVVSPSFGKILGSGGRYDFVLNSFDLDSNAFGFAFRLHYLESALRQQ